MHRDQSFMTSKPHVLFVTYGAGHANALLPVARALEGAGRARVSLLALTTAAASARSAGFAPLGFADFVEPGDTQALAWGRELAADLPAGGLVPRAESVAYLGLSFADLVAAHGLPEAREAYARHGRHAFLPVPTLRRVLRRLAPDAVVITNSPRAERAAGLAARDQGVPALCLNVLFAIDEIEWLRAPDFCDRVCVLNDAVRDFFVAAGRPADHLRVTGNPAFDALADPAHRDAGARLREAWSAGRERVMVLWASQPELVSHPTAPGKVGDPTFPSRVGHALRDWASHDPGRLVLARPHPSESGPVLQGAQVLLCLPGSQPLAPVLHACDAVVTMTSTVAVEAHSLGLPVVQVLGSIFDHSSPFGPMGVARAGPLEKLATILDESLLAGRVGASRSAMRADAATHVTRALMELL